MTHAAAGTLRLPAVTRAAGDVQLPGSKSISNRTLLLAALANGATTLRGLLDADDVTRMREALAALGIEVEPGTEPGSSVVRGRGGAIPARRAELFLGNAGTAFRPLTAVLAFARGAYVLRGVPRMHERPIRDLVDALRDAGGRIRYLGQDGYPPLAIDPAEESAVPDRVSIRGSVSSQFLSSLLMALPLVTSRTHRDVAVDVEGELISRPYVRMTTNLMRRFGVDVRESTSTFVVPAGAGYVSPGTLDVEGDASGASYFLAAGAIGGGPVRVHGVDAQSIQGDVEFARVLERWGADIRFGSGVIEARRGRRLAGADIDCGAIPDAAMTLAIVALFAESPTTLRAIGSWRVKETDRIAAMVKELARLGAEATAGDDWLHIRPPARLQPATIDTYDDHRMAMCFALACLGGVEVGINDPGCVAKTYPAFFTDFVKLLR